MRAGAALAALLAGLAVAATARAEVVVSVTFDDGVANQMEAVPLLAAHGMRATFYVNSARIGRAGYLTLDQLHALQAAGHEIGGHTADHARLTALDPLHQARQVCGDRAALLADGLHVRSFAYPFSAFDDGVERVIAGCGYDSARRSSGIQSSASCRGCPVSVPLPPPDPYAIRGVDSVERTTARAEIQAQVRAAADAGGWLPLVFHHVCDGCNDYGVTAAWLSELLTWLAAQPDVRVATVGEVVGGVMRPAVAAPPLTPVGDRQLLQNGAFALAGADGVPECFQRAGAGRSTATWRTVAGPGGRPAQQVTIVAVGRRSDRKLVSRQDAGLCAPAARRGERFLLRVPYRARGEARPVVYARVRGRWTFVAQGPALRRGGWRIARWATPRMPAGTSAVSVGLSLRSRGRLAVAGMVLRRR